MYTSISRQCCRCTCITYITLEGAACADECMSVISVVNPSNDGGAVWISKGEFKNKSRKVHII